MKKKKKTQTAVCMLVYGKNEATSGMIANAGRFSFYRQQQL